MSMTVETALLTAVSDLSSARELSSVTAVVRVAARTLTGADGVTFKFTPSGGRIDVRLESTPAAVALIVRDSGVGIGLTIVQELVALHGGIVSASSEGPNRGTTMRVELPRFVTHSAQAM